MLPAATNDQDLNTISEASKPQGASATEATGMSLYTSDGAGDTSPSADQSAAADDSRTTDDSKSNDDAPTGDWSRKASTLQHADLTQQKQG